MAIVCGVIIRLLKFLIKQNKGTETVFTINHLQPNQHYTFFIKFCNHFDCSSTNSSAFCTNESKPEGKVILEANAAGANQIQLKWSSDPSDPFVHNGKILFLVFIKGPFLLELNSTEMVDFKQNKKPFTVFQNLNLLNTTTMDTRYGIVDKILPYSTYYVQINATNSMGYLLSNQVKVETFKSIPEGIIPPHFVSSTSHTMQIEWYDPILPNSADQIFYFQIHYRQKDLWNPNGMLIEITYCSDHKNMFL